MSAVIDAIIFLCCGDEGSSIPSGSVEDDVEVNVVEACELLLEVVRHDGSEGYWWGQQNDVCCWGVVFSSIRNDDDGGGGGN
jgi:hypothetical protein